jgi:hypothetical protein
MSNSNTKETYADFKEFYTKAVEPLKQANPAFIRLDGKLKGDTRIVFAYFQYQDKNGKSMPIHISTALSLLLMRLKKGMILL